MVKDDIKEINGSANKIVSQNSESESPREIKGQSSIPTIQGPEDKGGVVFAIFLLWGIGVLLPWNAVLSIYDYFVADVSAYIIHLTLTFLMPDGRILSHQNVRLC
jgi:hypothetical protein